MCQASAWLLEVTGLVRGWQREAEFILDRLVRSQCQQTKIGKRADAVVYLKRQALPFGG
jgi:hypothetical protein